MPPDCWSKPRIGLSDLRPGALVEAAANDQVGLLHPRFKQTVDGDTRVPAIRWPDDSAPEHFA